MLPLAPSFLYSEPVRIILESTGNNPPTNKHADSLMGIERRQYPRVLVNWSAVVETPQGSVEGETKDISVDGVFIFCAKEPEIQENFPILLKASEQRTISIVGAKIWSGTFNIDNRKVFGMGIQFIHISPEDREYIAALVEKEQRD